MLIALFQMNSNVSPGKNGALTGGMVQAAQLASTSTAMVTNLASGSQGQVLDTDAAVKYSVFLGNSQAQEVLLDGQVLIGSPKFTFGNTGDSGSLVIMAQDGGQSSFRKGDALGLYTVIMGLGAYHFITPMHACMTALGASSIYRP